MITCTPKLRGNTVLVDSKLSLDGIHIGTFSRVSFDASYTFKMKRGIQLNSLELRDVLVAMVKIEKE